MKITKIASLCGIASMLTMAGSGPASGDENTPAKTVSPAPNVSVSSTAGVNAQQTTPLRQLMWSNDRQILSGMVPNVYKALNLTDEQLKTIEGICREAKDAGAALWKSLREEGHGRGSPQAYQEITKKQEELAQKFVTRMNDVLTAEQRELLKKIQDVLTEKAAADKKIQEEFAAQSRKLLETYEKKLDEMLTPEQKTRLAEALKKGSGGERPFGVPGNVRPGVPVRPMPAQTAPLPDGKPEAKSDAKIE